MIRKKEERSKDNNEQLDDVMNLEEEVGRDCRVLGLREEWQTWISRGRQGARVFVAQLHDHSAVSISTLCGCIQEWTRTPRLHRMNYKRRVRVWGF